MPLSPELLGLLHACKEDIEADGPRLILADWLQEHGDPRGEFVRIQVKRHRLPAWDERQATLARRESELLRRHRVEWLGDLAKRCQWVEFRRGLIAATVDRITPEHEPPTLPAWAWVEHLGVVHAFPVESQLQFVTACGIGSFKLGIPFHHGCGGNREWAGLSFLSMDGTRFEDVARARGHWPAIERVRALHLHNCSASVIEQVAAVCSGSLHRLDLTLCDFKIEHLERLPSSLLDLRVYGAHLGEQGGQLLADSPLLGQLHSLSLWVVRLGTAGFLALFRSPHLNHLVRLDLSSERMTVGGIKALGHSPHVENLVDLTLSECQLRAPHLKALAAAPLLGRLRRLDLYRNGFADDALIVLADSPHLGSLRELNLGHNEIRNQGAAHLARSGITNLGRLNLSSNPIRGDGFVALVPWLDRQKLVSLDLSHTYLEEKGLAALANCPGLENMIELDLSCTHLGDKGGKTLPSAPWLRGLTALNLFSARLGPEGLRSLLESGALGQLTALHLGENNLGDDGVRLLADWPGLSGLAELDLGSNDISDKGLSILLRSGRLSPGTKLGLTHNPLSVNAVQAAREQIGSVTFHPRFAEHVDEE
jgi:uncharacterized protein (TIGR02996 family)